MFVNFINLRNNKLHLLPLIKLDVPQAQNVDLGILNEEIFNTFFG